MSGLWPLRFLASSNCGSRWKENGPSAAQGQSARTGRHTRLHAPALRYHEHSAAVDGKKESQMKASVWRDARREEGPTRAFFLKAQEIAGDHQLLSPLGRARTVPGNRPIVAAPTVDGAAIAQSPIPQSVCPLRKHVKKASVSRWTRSQSIVCARQKQSLFSCYTRTVFTSGGALLYSTVTQFFTQPRNICSPRTETHETCMSGAAEGAGGWRGPGVD